MKKKNLLLLASGYENWKGGLYYIRNMLYALLQYEKTSQEYNIFILINQDDYDVFSDFVQLYSNVEIIIDKKKIYHELKRKIRKIIHVCLMKQSIVWELSDGIMEKYKINTVFPLLKPDYKYLQDGIAWIPDFQHFHYPNFFSSKEISIRNNCFKEIAENHSKLVLSSTSAYNDYRNAYPNHTQGVYIVPFVSAIQRQKMTREECVGLFDRYSIPEKYYLISNQFWSHKNHETVFKAVKWLKEHNERTITIACTGLLENSKNPEYTEKLKQFISQNALEDQIRILGLINRKEQLQLMQNCVSVIQPSLFEGWGTVVEDAKSLGKRVIMSDIDVHYEQRNSNCVMFEKTNYQQLAEVMKELWYQEKKKLVDDYNIIEQATEYGRLFYEVISMKNNEK